MTKNMIFFLKISDKEKQNVKNPYVDKKNTSFHDIYIAAKISLLVIFYVVNVIYPSRRTLT